MYSAGVPFWEAFLLLGKGRVWMEGMSGRYPNAIPYSEIAQYAKDHGYADVAELDLFVYLVQRLDEVFLKQYAGIRERHRNTANSPSRG